LQKTFCNACFTGRYPLNVQMQMDRLEASREREPALAALESLNRAGRP